MTSPKLPLLAALLAAMLLTVAACGDDDSDSASPTATTTGTSVAVGPGISISEALSSTLDQPLLVNGFLVVQGDEARLCEALAESFPPQCGGASLLVEGLDLETIEGLQTEQRTNWTDETIQLLGRVEDGVLTISGSATS